MRKYLTGIFVILVMLVAILGITNPGREEYKMFGYVEGKMIHDYFIFSVYQQVSGYTTTDDGKYRICKRYVGICMGFYEIKPVKIKLE